MPKPCPTEEQSNPSTSHTVMQAEAAGISLNMRIPPFWRDRPRLWFISFEAATNDLKKSQAQLAQMVIAVLPQLNSQKPDSNFMAALKCATRCAAGLPDECEIAQQCSNERRRRTGERPYELDDEALRRLLLRPDVRDLPVVVLSVAGAFRGGKSFILDFFLRYLYASHSSQLSGEWLGNEDDQLKGFHWRGGCERDTTGIHLWPEPIIATLKNGEKVAVLLMDTQGTFDSETTVGQNSTIFALSTLISSVQIYNLSSNIKEDDLQHLQLFTEYGKVACDAEGKAFQTLLFLVRDWLSPYYHAHGFEGGSELLNRRLQSNPNQNAELRDVREHINSSFDQIKCFLMPHPGLCVSNKNFAGCIRDLTEEFRSKLLELVPALFDPEHLTPKLINGERVRTQDLLDYFQKYVDIFNSGEVPEAVTIFKATADACLMAATRAARSLYAARMAERVRGARSLPAGALAAAHAAARADAELCFTQKKKLGAQQDADARLLELIEDLDGSLSQYILQNEAKVRETMSLAMKTYDAAVSSVCGDHARLCLHPEHLAHLHAEAGMAALALFDAARDVLEDDEDDQRPELEQSLKQKYENLCVINDRNNKSAVLEARELYVTRMKKELEQAGVSSNKLLEQDQAARNDAEASFARLRNCATTLEDDPFAEQLLQQIECCYLEFKRTNENNKRFAMQAAENKYNNYITSAWGSQMCCFHPRALVDLHKKGVEETLEHCLADKDDDEDDEYNEEVKETLETRFLELVTVNEYNNDRAVEDAVLYYNMKIGQLREPAPWGGLLGALGEVVVNLFGAKSKWKPSQNQHDHYKREAVQVFKKRRRGNEYPDDKYYNNVITTIDAAYRDL